MVLDVLKKLMKENAFVLRAVSRLYRFFHYNNIWRYRYCGNNTFEIQGSFLKSTKFKIDGGDNRIIIGPKARLFDCEIIIIGSGNTLEIKGGSTIISKTSFWMQHGGNKIIIGHDSTIEGGHIAATERTTVLIGNDCMFSNDIEIRTGDSHSIICNETKHRVNHAKDVVIGNHVWLTAHVRVMKGSVIPDNSIVGNSSVVTTVFDKQNAIYAGIPAKRIKENISWDRYLR